MRNYCTAQNLFKFFFFIYLLMAVLGLHCCVGFFLVLVQGGFSCCGSRALEHRLNSCGTGLAALQHVGSSQTRD